jgi:ATP-dependent protease HslVU (ClpYQ) peptidase subunit
VTCIVGVEEDGKVVIGGDSAGVDGWLRRTVRADAKVFTNGPFIMGFTTSFRMGQLLRYNLKVAAKPEGVDDDEYMSTWFIDAVRACLKTGGYAKVEYQREEGGVFLVGYHGHLYAVEDDFQVGRSVETFAAVGCGATLALGALHALRSWGASLSAEEAVVRALESAQHFSAGVAAPFVVLEGGAE